jgi:catechol 2,3-dioxygenase-like lactoylglutathione lyase family enzyme
MKSIRRLSPSALSALVLSALSVAVIGNATAAGPVVPEGFGVSPINRATIFVRDQEKSLKLYRDLLGLHVFFNNYWDNGGINAIMNTHGETLRAIVVESGDGVFGKLGIYQLSAASVAKAPPPEQSTTTKVGDFAIVFTTNDVDGYTAKIKAAGYPIISPPVVLKENPAYEVQGREMMFRDPDGVLVNLVQPGILKTK